MNLEKPKINDAFRILHEKAHEYISEQQERLEKDYGFGQFANYTVDWEQSILSFIREDNSSLDFTFQIVGTLDAEHWSWRWNNPEILQEEKEELDIIKNYGEFYDFSYLTVPDLEVSMSIAWALTAISGYLRVCKGIFRIQQDSIAHFVYFKEIQA